MEPIVGIRGARKYQGTVLGIGAGQVLLQFRGKFEGLKTAPEEGFKSFPQLNPSV
jgi:hypothetical protein